MRRHCNTASGKCEGFTREQVVPTGTEHQDDIRGGAQGGNTASESSDVRAEVASMRNTRDKITTRTMSLQKMLASTIKQDTNDTVIREHLKAELTSLHAKDSRVRIIEEFGVRHGSARVDVAVVNGILHGYEIKSDRDTLLRLPEQMHAYNAVFDRVTLVVGKTHLYEAMHFVPEWWGITIAKALPDRPVFFCEIREGKENPDKDSIAMAQLLWRQEALNILEKEGAATGVRSKSREAIYAKLATTFDQQSLSEKVRETLFFRDWRLDSPLQLNGD